MRPGSGRHPPNQHQKQELGYRGMVGRCGLAGHAV